MTLALVNPNTSTTTTAVMVDIAAQEAGADVHIEGFTAPFGAPLITGPDALDHAAEAVVALAPELSRADAVIVAAFGDPGLSQLRSILDVPVTGIAEAAMAEAAAVGRRFAVATTTPDLVSRISETARKLGHHGFAGTWTTTGDPVVVTTDPDAATSALMEAILAAVRDAQVDAVVIGGGPLAVAARALVKTSPVPLIEPVPAAVRLSLSRIREGADQ
ncbi:aspartate/glutamate racemase family protein [uncultured Roseobacter sp.]|uniref:aspartate/glutamate racemase family protein n=1 Tax=uncultured Roseobacter sp. TaxID=114847 RepID=UPI00263975D3|nr:aspartate/glutamate racemase family protein [uncultured Roseobacter sp.]